MRFGVPWVLMSSTDWVFQWTPRLIFNHQFCRLHKYFNFLFKTLPSKCELRNKWLRTIRRRAIWLRSKNLMFVVFIGMHSLYKFRLPCYSFVFFAIITASTSNWFAVTTFMIPKDVHCVQNFAFMFAKSVAKMGMRHTPLNIASRSESSHKKTLKSWISSVYVHILDRNTTLLKQPLSHCRWTEDLEVLNSSP